MSRHFKKGVAIVVVNSLKEIINRLAQQSIKDLGEEKSKPLLEVLTDLTIILDFYVDTF